MVKERFQLVALGGEEAYYRPWDESPKRVVSIIVVEGWAIFVNLTSYMYADGWKKYPTLKLVF